MRFYFHKPPFIKITSLLIVKDKISHENNFEKMKVKTPNDCLARTTNEEQEQKQTGVLLSLELFIRYP